MLKSGLTNSAEETADLGRRLGERLPDEAVVSFFGGLGAGKTTFIKGLVEGASGCSLNEIQSPTFTYLNIYEGPKGKVYHFDLYRLKGVEEFLGMGFDEYFTGGGICCIEWSEKIEEILPADSVRVVIEHAGPHQRKVSIFE